MGVAYKALQVSTKRIVALKVMLTGPFSSPSARRRFEREVELAARLQHSNIVRVLESGCVAQQQYYAMDYVTGVPLNRHLSATQPDVRTTLSMFERICEAVDYAHRRGVVLAGLGAVMAAGARAKRIMPFRHAPRRTPAAAIIYG